MTFLPLHSSRLALVCTSGLLALSTALTAAPSQAQTWGRPLYAPPPVGNQAPYSTPHPPPPNYRYGQY